jgi:outer membrane immunogenic protein
MKRVLCAVILVAGLTAPASAQMFNWTGFYIGVNGGYAWADGSARITENTNNTVHSRSLDLDSWFAGLQAGLNFRNGNYVWGLEGDVQWADGSDSSVITYADGPGNVSAQLDWFATLRGRVGALNGPVLYYITGGAAWQGSRFNVFIPFDVTQAAFSGKPKMGWVAGAGAEWVVGGNWTAKFEYQYLDFGARTVSALGTGGEIVTGRFKLDIHTVRLGLNLQFATGGN